jgi:hypothetical protein
VSASRLNTEQLGRAFASSADAPASRSAVRWRRIVILVWCTTVALAIGAVIGLSVWPGVQEKKLSKNLDIPLQSAQLDGFISNPSGDLQMIKMNNVLMASAVASAASLGMCADAFAQSSAVQWTTASGGNGHWYSVRVFTSELTPSEYFDLATAIGGYGASITNQAEDEFVYQLSVATPGGWSVLCGLGPLLGGGRLSGCNFTWLTGEPWGYTSWGPADPSHCGEQYLQYCVCGQSSECARRWWIDTDMTVKPSGVIEWSADCNADGIVDYGQCHDGSLPDYNSNNIPDCCEQGVACVAGSYPVCWRIEDGGNGHWYQLGGPFLSTWTSAKTAANQSGGHLVTLTSATEQSFAATIAFQSSPLQIDDCWLGGYQDHAAADYLEPAGGWRWVTNEPWAFTAWRPDGHPSGQGDYLAATTVRFDSLGWVDSQMSHEPGNCQAFIEWSADCNNDGIVDYGQILSGQLIDANSNGIPDICDVDPCPGDISGNNSVDGVDLAALLGTWGTNGQGEFDCDIDNDGIVGGPDLTIILGGWGPCPN